MRSENEARLLEAEKREQTRRKEQRELGQIKLRLIRELQGAKLPLGTRDKIRRARDIDELVEVAASIRSALSIEGATPARLALAAARGDKNAAKALELLNPGAIAVTIPTLARQAAQGDEAAKTAIEILKELRKPKSRRRRQTVPQLEGAPCGAPEAVTPGQGLEELPGGGVRGRRQFGARPRVRSFKRIK